MKAYPLFLLLLFALWSCDETKDDCDTTNCGDDSKNVEARVQAKTHFELALDENRNIALHITIATPTRYKNIAYQLTNYYSKNVEVFDGGKWKSTPLSNGKLVVNNINGETRFRLPVRSASHLKKIQDKDVELSVVTSGFFMEYRKEAVSSLKLQWFSVEDIEVKASSMTDEELAVYEVTKGNKLQLFAFRSEMKPVQNRNELEPFILALDIERMQQTFDYMRNLLPDMTKKFIRQVDVLYSDRTLGYVKPQFVNSHDNWVMGINLLHAFRSSDINSKSFNFPAFELTMLHEFTHIWTFETSQMLTLLGEKKDCPNYFTEGFGCQNKDSYLNQFYQSYWKGKNTGDAEANYTANPKDFVSVYAASTVEEDIAESNSYMLLESKVSELGSLSFLRFKKMKTLFDFSVFNTIYTKLPVRFRVGTYGEISQKEFRKQLLNAHTHDNFFKHAKRTNCLKIH